MLGKVEIPPSSKSLDFFNVGKEEPTPGKRLELFVDINYSIIVTSSRKGSDKKTGTLSLLAGHYSAVWDATITTEKMTFKDFVTNHLYPDNEEKQIEQYTNFIEFLKQNNHLEILNEVVKEYEELMKIFEQNEKDDNIFPSFIKLILHLEANKNKTPYTLILRTFGRDLAKTVAELERRTPIKFISHAHFDNDGYLIIGDEKKKSPEEIRSVIKPFEHGAWQDNYTRWEASEFIAAGKLFPIDFNNGNLVSVFWDDSIGEKNKKIVTLKLASGEVITDCERFEKELINMKHLVSVDAIKAIKDGDYFINLKNSAYDGPSLKDSKELQSLIQPAVSMEADSIDCRETTSATTSTGFFAIDATSVVHVKKDGSILAFK